MLDGTSRVPAASEAARFADPLRPPWEGASSRLADPEAASSTTQVSGVAGALPSAGVNPHRARGPSGCFALGAVPRPAPQAASTVGTCAGPRPSRRSAILVSLRHRPPMEVGAVLLLSRPPAAIVDSHSLPFLLATPSRRALARGARRPCRRQPPPGAAPLAAPSEGTPGRLALARAWPGTRTPQCEPATGVGARLS